MAYASDSEHEYMLMPVRSHAGSVSGRSRRGGDGRRSPTVVNNYLGVPQARPRASSTGGGVQPTIVNIGTLPSEHGRSSRSRSRSHHRHHSRSSSSSYSSRSRHQSHRSRSRNRQPLSEEDLPYNVRRDIDYARQSRKDDEERKLEERLRKAQAEEKKR